MPKQPARIVTHAEVFMRTERNEHTPPQESESSLKAIVAPVALSTRTTVSPAQQSGARSTRVMTAEARAALRCRQVSDRSWAARQHCTVAVAPLRALARRPGHATCSGAEGLTAADEELARRA